MSSEAKKYGKKLAKCAGVRALKTVAQSAVAAIGSASMVGGVDWRMVASTAILAGILSLLSSVAGLPEVKDSADEADEGKKEEEEEKGEG